MYRTRVRSHQTDLNAAMHHGAFLDIFDDARVEMFRRMGYTYERMAAGEWTVVIRRIECDFRAPAQMDDLLEVTVASLSLAHASMVLRYECRRENRIVAEARSVYAFIDSRRKLMRVPPDLVAVVGEYHHLFGGDVSSSATGS